MFNFSTVVSGTVAVIQAGIDLIDPTTLVGGIVTVGLVGSLLVRMVRRLTRLAR